MLGHSAIAESPLSAFPPHQLIVPAGAYALTGATVGLIKNQAISLAATQAAFRWRYPGKWIELLTITHASLSTTLRVANNAKDQDITSNGNTFSAFPFELVILQDDDESPRAQLRIQNVDRVIGDAVLKATSPIYIDYQIVLSEDPDTIIEETPIALTLRDVQGNALEVAGTLLYDNIETEPAPWRRATQARCPAAWYGR